MTNGGGLQLLPETRKKVEVYVPGQNRLLTVAAVFVFMVLLVYGGLFLYRRSSEQKIASADQQLAAVEKSRSPKDEEKLLALKESIAAAKPILTGHVIWTAAFDRVQKLVLPQIQFDNLSVKLGKNEYTFKAFAANYITVARQIAAFNQDEAITDVAIDKITGRPDGKVEFNAILTLDLSKINRPVKK